MNKIKKLLVVTTLALTSAAAFAGCEEKPHKHSLQKTTAKVATCTTAGNTEYYTCDGCGKYYSDAEAKHEIDKNSWLIASTGHAWTDANDHECNNECGFTRETATYNEWDGTKANALPAAEVIQDKETITITTAEELAKLAELVNAGETFEDVVIKLDADINLKNREWTPIGYGYKKDDVVTGSCFKGTFDGQNHTISNLKITGSIGGKNGVGAAGVGLFGYAHNAHISRIKIDGAVVTGNHYVAAVVGFTYFSTIDDCDVVNASVSCTLLNDDENGDKAGIITGYLDDSNLTNCNVSDSTVSSSRDAGQLIGCESNNLASNGEEDITTGNSATNVVVTWNNTGTGANINNDFVGRHG